MGLLRIATVCCVVLVLLLLSVQLRVPMRPCDSGTPAHVQQLGRDANVKSQTVCSLDDVPVPLRRAAQRCLTCTAKNFSLSFRALEFSPAPPLWLWAQCCCCFQVCSVNEALQFFRPDYLSPSHDKHAVTRSSQRPCMLHPAPLCHRDEAAFTRHLVQHQVQAHHTIWKKPRKEMILLQIIHSSSSCLR